MTPTSPTCAPTAKTSRLNSHAIGIVAHTKRAAQARTLKAAVGATAISIDNGDLGAFGNHLRTWQLLRDIRADADWLVVLEDDAVPVDDFTAQLGAALDCAPSPVVSLYLGRTRPADVQRQIRTLIDNDPQACWIQSHRMLHAVGIALRADVVDDMLDTIITSPFVFEPFDKALGMWAAMSTPISYTWPSLVDHADEQSVITEHPDGKPRGPIIATDSGIPILARRVAWRTGTRRQWDDTAVTLAL